MEFKKNYTFAGNPPIDLLMQNLTYIREHLSPETNLIFILGSEIKTDKTLEGYDGVCDMHILLNKHPCENKSTHVRIMAPYDLSY